MLIPIVSIMFPVSHPEWIYQLNYERTILRQVYDWIETSGVQGQGRSEIVSKLGGSRLDTRLVCRNLVRKNCIVGYWTDAQKCSYERSVCHFDVFLPLYLISCKRVCIPWCTYLPRVLCVYFIWVSFTSFCWQLGSIR